ncbi:hypothetical protein ASD13_02355 [Microbacterium sp. Root1433D1]|uniref:hypothetical protein n=1 Tax=Microbacterium sp. Root1433D1 TaxID=1736463 RepID=UPI0006F9C031|nr:hypothetical protein [Microbacterium sp. Root1433D1]KQY77541.1 hypothetical protein ASD13_02355 [Microbacterium sp. Root1433D1]
MSPDAAYDQLSRALEMRAPKCNGDPRFTEDRITPTVAKELAEICWTCDVALLCRQYANVADPKIGYWAGHRATPRPPTSNAGRRGAAKQTRPKRDTAATAAAKRIAWCRAHAARLRDAVSRGEIEPWYLDTAAHYETEADQHEHASGAA